MGASVAHLQEHPKTGRLSYRRAFPPELRQHIPGNPGELKRSLGAKSITAAGAMARFQEASDEYNRVVAKARKLATRSFDSLDEPTIAYLAKLFERQEAQWVEKQLRAGGSDFAEKFLDGLWWSEGDYIEWRVEDDLEEMIKRWGGAAHGLLQDRGIILDPADEDALGSLCRALNEVIIATREEVRSRLRGQVIPIPEEPTPPPRHGNQVAVTAGQGLSFQDIAEDILENSVPPVRHSTREGVRTALRFFREANGLLPPAKITRALVTTWIRQLAERPAKLPAGERNIGLPELVALYASRPDVPRLSQKTLSQHVGHLAATWAKARRDGIEAIPYDLANPFADRKFDIAAPPEEPQEMSLDELHAIFALPIFTRHELPKRGRGWASYWMPLLMLWTGARPEEIAQLMVEDITKDAKGRWQLRITDEGTHPVKGKRWLKTAKKGTGRRTFPIPKALLDLNLIEYVDHLREAGETALFPALTTKGMRGLLFTVWGEWWSLHLQKEGILPPPGQGRRASRELRHNWPSAARASRLPEEVREYVMGHGTLKTSRGYGSEKALGEWIDLLRFEGLDLSGVKPWTPDAA